MKKSFAKLLFLVAIPSGWDILVGMKTYICTDDGSYEERIEANSPQEAAETYVEGGDWGDGSETLWIRVRVKEENADDDEEEWVKVCVEATEADCPEGEHDWQSPHSVVGGMRENPGVWGQGGGVVIREVCAHCGLYKVINTWAQDPTDGEQGLQSVEYQPADYDSLEWIEAERRSKAAV